MPCSLVDTLAVAQRGIYPIQSVALRTGVTAYTIRAWERRYGVVTPERVGGRRLYSEADVARLALLKRAVDSGHRIGTVANLPGPALRRLLAGRPEAPETTDAQALPEAVHRAVAHAAAIDERGFDAELYDAVRTYGASGVVEAFIFPVLRELGRRWRLGTAEIAEEHIVTSAIRGYLSTRLRDLVPPAGAPVLVVAAPEGELHDIGCLAGAIRAAEAGWRVVYLGANTPAESIVHVAVTTSAAAVLLVVTFAIERLGQFLEQLVAGIGEAMAAAIAGHLDSEMIAAAEGLGYRPVSTMSDLDEFLRRSAGAGSA